MLCPLPGALHLPPSEASSLLLILRRRNSSSSGGGGTSDTEQVALPISLSESARRRYHPYIAVSCHELNATCPLQSHPSIRPSVHLSGGPSAAEHRAALSLSAVVGHSDYLPTVVLSSQVAFYSNT
uniref:Uncharacterized protein n=1 Tax=Onchocerca volvulus TaxID=6282 RepID=A0A8R1TSZ1_ONCVO